ncbi:MAG: MATE family efflux transporter [Muribaculaceae bacterium]|nr:MATE family efflux transporter [Muribaculaceae bacterium]
MVSADNKRIAKNTIFLYIRSILIILVALYTTRITLEVLGEVNYGIYNIVGGVVVLFSVLGNTMVAASQRFITYSLGKNDRKWTKEVFDNCVSIHAVIVILLFPILELLGLWLLYSKLSIPVDRMHAAFWVLQCSILNLLANIILIPFTALIIAYERMSTYAYISIVEVVLKLGAVLLLQHFFKEKLIAYAVMLVLIAIVVQLIYSVYSYRSFEEAKKIKLRANKGLFKEMFAFSGWNLIGAGSGVLRNQGIDILLNIYFGVILNAAKGICAQVQNAITQFITNFQTAVNPQLTKSIAQENYLRNHMLVIQGGRFSFFLMSVFSIPIITNCSSILQLWLKEIPDWTVLFIQWTLIYCLWDCLSRFLINSIMATGNIRNYQLIVGGTKLLVLPIVWILFYCGWPPLTGIWINIIIEIVCLGERLWFNRKYTGLSPKEYLIKAVGPCWLCFLITFAAVMVIKCYCLSNIISLLPISLVLTVTIIWIIGLNGKERQTVKEMVKSRFHL